MKARSYRLEDLAHLVQGESFGHKDLSLTGLASLEHAHPNQISFVNGDKYLEAAQVSKAGALIVPALSLIHISEPTRPY